MSDHIAARKKFGAARLEFARYFKRPLSDFYDIRTSQCALTYKLNLN